MPLQPVGIAGAVEEFVVVAHGVEHLGGDAGDAAQRVVAELGVALHDRHLAVGERAGLVEDLERDRGLADVVQGRGDAEPLHVGGVEAEAEREIDRDAGHQQAVLEGAFMVAAHVVEPGGEPVGRDRVDDLAWSPPALRRDRPACRCRTAANIEASAAADVHHRRRLAACRRGCHRRARRDRASPDDAAGCAHRAARE